jgi:hypothetical protein
MMFFFLIKVFSVFKYRGIFVLYNPIARDLDAGAEFGFGAIAAEVEVERDILDGLGFFAGFFPIAC